MHVANVRRYRLGHTIEITITSVYSECRFVSNFTDNTGSLYVLYIFIFIVLSKNL